MSKIYVDVIAKFSESGKLTPLTLIWEDGRKFSIDKVKDCRRAASLKAGGVGLRYTCMIEGKEKFLFYEEDRWFVEGR